MDGNSIQKRVRELINPINVVLVFIEIVFIVIVSFIFINNNDEMQEIPKIDISDNFGSIEGLEEVSKANIEEVLYDVAVANNDSFQPFSSSDFHIREGSLLNQRIESMGMRYVSFIVDLDNTRQSYRVFYEQFDENDETGEFNERVSEAFAVCLSNDDERNNDGEYMCKDNNDDAVMKYIVFSILKEVSFEDFYAYIDEGDLNKIKIVSRYYNHSLEQDAEYTRQVREFVESLGIPSELFEYYIVPVEELEVL